jgi:NADH:ubiquinone oxidoreductase subunit F (NADH-binding)
MTGPAGYLSGESTAIKSAVHGGPAVPQFRRHGRSSQGSEILVHNVETLARLAALARIAATTPSCAAPALPTRSYRLLTVLTPTQERRVVEVDSSASLAEAVQVAVGERPAPDAAVLVGGYGGTWARWSEISCLPVSQDSMRRAGHSLGPGIIAPMWEPGCELAATKAVVDYLARSSAGQCGPCLFGLPAMAESLTRLAEGRPRRHEVAALRRDIGAVEGRGACHHPDGAVSLVRSALRLFGDDIELHASGRTCGRPAENLIPVPGSDRSE